MKKLNIVLLGLLFLFAQAPVFAELNQSDAEIVSNTIETKIAPETVENTFDEVEKWLFIEKHFASNIDSSKIYKKIGHFLKEYSSEFSALMSPFIGVLSALIFCGIIGVNLENKESAKIAYPLIIFVTPVIVFLVSNKILQLIGTRIENKNGQCSQILTDFVKNWDLYKAQTPTAMHPIFQKLSENLSQEGTLTKIDNDLARKIVESVIATALVVRSIG